MQYFPCKTKYRMFHMLVAERPEHLWSSVVFVSELKSYCFLQTLRRNDPPLVSWCTVSFPGIIWMNQWPSSLTTTGYPLNSFAPLLIVYTPWLSGVPQMCSGLQSSLITKRPHTSYCYIRYRGMMKLRHRHPKVRCGEENSWYWEGTTIIVLY